MVPLILASGSQTRATLLRNAGVSFSVRTAAIDERAVEAPLIARGAKPRDVAAALAEAKALAVSRQHPGLVIGADQTLDLAGRQWSKPRSLAEAAEQSAALAGRTHALHSALAVARDGAIAWRHVESARLAMRPLTGAEIAAYIAEVGDAALTSVGAYQIEGPGIRLFERIDGDHFTILGLPLLPLLAYLRAEGTIL
ncbi:Maf-like protein [soil metagenome]